MAWDEMIAVITLAVALLGAFLGLVNLWWNLAERR